MSLRHFFEGMVRREEIASAYLATLLQYSPTFREKFLQLAFRNPDFVDAETWTTRVEAELVDVTVESSSTIVLIENKLGSGARMLGQLVRYYAAAVARNPQKRVVAVYLTPGGFGADEVEGVMTSPLRIGRTDDSLVIPWEEVARIVSALPAEEWFAHSGMAAILESIENRRKEKFPAVGERATLRRIVTEARNGLSARWPEVRFALWVGQTSETVYSFGVPITVNPEPAFRGGTRLSVHANGHSH